MGIIVLENPEYCKVGLNNRQEGRQRSDCRESFFYTGCIHAPRGTAAASTLSIFAV